MVKSVLSVSHRGLNAWVVQRLSAFYMAIYTIVLMVYLGINPALTFAEWHTLYACTWVKITTILFLVGMLLHAWVGIWTIFTDYVKPVLLRAVLECLVLLMLAACLVWGIMILWSV